MVSRPHQLLLELMPGRAKKHLSAKQAKALLATVRRRDIAGKTRCRTAADELADLVAVDAMLKQIKAELTAAVAARGSTLTQIHGIGPAGAARILADVSDVARFANRNRFASWTGTAPLDASSGEQIRHRMSRAGNRRMKHVIHVAAIVLLRHDTEGRAYYRRKLAAGQDPDGGTALPQAPHLRHHLRTPRRRQHSSRGHRHGHRCGYRSRYE